MKDGKKIKLLKTFQQSELDACIMYKGLAELMKDAADRELLLQLGAEEGKHAGILKGITNEVLSPRSSLKNITAAMYKAAGKKALFKALSAGEAAAAKAYRPFSESFPETQAIADDELMHGRLLKENLKEKNA